MQSIVYSYNKNHFYNSLTSKKTNIKACSNYLNEVYGEGNAYDFGARIYDPRLGRWMAADPMAMKYPFFSPYVGLGDNPIIYIDPGGETLEFANAESENAYNLFYLEADENTQAQLNTLNISDVIYLIDVNSTSISGRVAETSYDFGTSKVLVSVSSTHGDKIGALGDELTTAYRFETDKIGYALLSTGAVRTLGYDMEDEAASKSGEVAAIARHNLIRRSINMDVGLPAEVGMITMDNTTQAFNKADTDPVPPGQTRNQMIENYFNTDASAQSYIKDFSLTGRKMGVNISPGDVQKSDYDDVVNKGTLKKYVYRQKGVTVKEN